jgi:hypothetical protein
MEHIRKRLRLIFPKSDEFPVVIEIMICEYIKSNIIVVLQTNKNQSDDADVVKIEDTTLARNNLLNMYVIDPLKNMLSSQWQKFVVELPDTCKSQKLINTVTFQKSMTSSTTRLIRRNYTNTNNNVEVIHKLFSIEEHEFGISKKESKTTEVQDAADDLLLASWPSQDTIEHCSFGIVTVSRNCVSRNCVDHDPNFQKNNGLTQSNLYKCTTTRYLPREKSFVNSIQSLNRTTMNWKHEISFNSILAIICHGWHSSKMILLPNPRYNNPQGCKHCYVYDSSTNVVTQLADLLFTQSSFLDTVITLPNHDILLFGGKLEADAPNIDKVQRYIASENKWILSNLTIPNHVFLAVAAFSPNTGVWIDTCHIVNGIICVRILKTDTVNYQIACLDISSNFSEEYFGSTHCRSQWYLLPILPHTDDTRIVTPPLACLLPFE